MVNFLINKSLLSLTLYTFTQITQSFLCFHGFFPQGQYFLTFFLSFFIPHGVIHFTVSSNNSKWTGWQEWTTGVRQQTADSRALLQGLELVKHFFFFVFAIFYQLLSLWSHVLYPPCFSWPSRVLCLSCGTSGTWYLWYIFSIYEQPCLLVWIKMVYMLSCHQTGNLSILGMSDNIGRPIIGWYWLIYWLVIILLYMVYIDIDCYHLSVSLLVFPPIMKPR